jgi:hypothetical protein
VLGASGYVGSNLVPKLAALGWTTRAAARRPAVLEARGWQGVETVAADALVPASLDPALEGIDVAYYLVHSMAAGADFPDLDREAARNFAAAAAAALAAERANEGSSRWTEGSMLYRRNRPDFAFYAKQMRGEAVTTAPADAVWREVAAVGGENGYYFLDGLWKLRGRLDQMVGGTGMRRGRRDPQDLAVGDTVDFWRVVAVEPGRRLTLLAEMKLPGSAALDFELRPQGEGRTRIVVTAYFHPAGARGLLYWHALAPAHLVIFDGFARAIARRAESGLGAPLGTRALR